MSKMGEIKLKLKKTPDFPLEAESITTNNFAGKTLAEIKKLPLYHSKELVTIGDFFSASGKGDDDPKNIKIIIDGDLSKVKRIGEMMNGGEIIINGNVGMHVANHMKSGKITVNGNADDWAGAMLEGGELEINGDAGHYVGAAYRGYWQGMKNGIIKVKGKVGIESMLWAKSSKPANKWPTLYCGSASSFLGIHNHGATIVVEGDVDRCIGADQSRGTIVIKGKINRILPSFKKMGEVNEIELPNGDKITGKFVEYSGDHSVSKETAGRLYVAI
ncbi:MAG: formylmethanofuran dehydrogenase subunit C [Promethearchaeota archaeon]|nr:MAG: formylmethanofuran dehydrogenase subunit C [Candidatus Lokiarchaeota archaeon]